MKKFSTLLALCWLWCSAPLLGQPVRTQALRHGTADLSTDGLATGTYLLTVQVPGGTQCVLVE